MCLSGTFVTCLSSVWANYPHILTYTNADTHKNIHTGSHIHRNAYIFTHTRTHTHTHRITHTEMHTYSHTQEHTLSGTYTRRNVYICTLRSTHTGAHAHTETRKYIHTQEHTHTHTPHAQCPPTLLQVTTPVAIMTSDAKGNHQSMVHLLESLNWFGRGKETFRLFRWAFSRLAESVGVRPKVEELLCLSR